MYICDGNVVTIDYILTDSEGKELDKSENGEFAYLHGARNIIPGLEKALQNKQAGDAFSVAVKAEEAYGKRDAALIQIVSRDMFPEDASVTVGDAFHAATPDGHSIRIFVAAIDGDNVTIDGNHPLADLNLNFAVKVISVRESTDEERDHGHVHGAHDHHHE